MMVVCPVGRRVYKIDWPGPCPGLVFEGQTATCTLVRDGVVSRDVIGIDTECDTTATAHFPEGGSVQWNTLPCETKRAVVEAVKKKTITTITKEPSYVTRRNGQR